MAEEKEPKIIEEKTITYRGFKDAEEAKKFLDDMRNEMEKTWRSFDRIFEGTRQLLSPLNFQFFYMDNVFKPYSVNDEIEYHQQRIKRLEEKKKLMLPAKEEKKNEL